VSRIRVAPLAPMSGPIVFPALTQWARMWLEEPVIVTAPAPNETRRSYRDDYMARDYAEGLRLLADGVERELWGPS